MRYGSIFLIKMLDISNICFYNKHMFELYSDLTIMEKLEILADAASMMLHVHKWSRQEGEERLPWEQRGMRCMS